MLIYRTVLVNARRTTLMKKVTILLALTRNDKHPWGGMADMELFRSAGLFEEDRMSGKKGFSLAGILFLEKMK